MVSVTASVVTPDGGGEAGVRMDHGGCRISRGSSVPQFLRGLRRAMDLAADQRSPMWDAQPLLASLHLVALLSSELTHLGFDLAGNLENIGSDLM